MARRDRGREHRPHGAARGAVRRVSLRHAARRRGSALRCRPPANPARPRLHRHAGRRPASISRARASASMRRCTTQARADLGIGLAYRSRTTIDVRRQRELHRARRVQREDARPDRARRTMTLPDVSSCSVGAGAAAISRSLGDLEYTRVERQRARPRSTSPNDATPTAMQENNWHDTFTVRAGAEWQRGKLTLARRRVLRSVAGPGRAPDADGARRLRASRSRPARAIGSRRAGARTCSPSRCGSCAAIRRAPTRCPRATVAPRSCSAPACATRANGRTRCRSRRARAGNQLHRVAARRRRCARSRRDPRSTSRR